MTATLEILSEQIRNLEENISDLESKGLNSQLLQEKKKKLLELLMKSSTAIMENKQILKG